MRSIARLAAAFAGSLCLGLAVAPAAVAAPTASVTPSVVAPGGTVTVTVTCPVTQNSPGGSSIQATSRAFARGTVSLAARPNNPPGGITYSGTAQIAPRSSFPSTGANAVGRTSTWSVTGNCGGSSGESFRATFTVDRDMPSGGTQGGFGPADTGASVLAGGLAVLGATAGGIYLLRRRASQSAGA